MIHTRNMSEVYEGFRCRSCSSSVLCSSFLCSSLFYRSLLCSVLRLSLTNMMSMVYIVYWMYWMYYYWSIRIHSLHSPLPGVSSEASGYERVWETSIWRGQGQGEE